MAGILLGTDVFGIDGGDAIVKLECLRAQNLLRFRRLETVEARVVPGE